MTGVVFIDDAAETVGRAIARQAITAGYAVLDGAIASPSVEGRRLPDAPDSPAFSLTAPAVLREQRIDRMFICRRPVAHGSLEDLTPDMWEQVVIAYLTSLRITVQAGLAAMGDARAGSITILLDPDVEAVVPNSLVSATTAAACAGFIRGVAMDVAKHGIRVNGVTRGILMPLALEPREDLKKAARTATVGWEAIPLLSGVRAIDLARAMWFLSGPRSRSTTGAVLRVDGGMIAQRFRKRRLAEVTDLV